MISDLVNLVVLPSILPIKEVPLVYSVVVDEKRMLPELNVFFVLEEAFPPMTDNVNCVLWVNFLRFLALVLVMCVDLVQK